MHRSSSSSRVGRARLVLQQQQRLLMLPIWERLVQKRQRHWQLLQLH
jgi:hypothetical protein